MDQFIRLLDPLEEDRMHDVSICDRTGVRGQDVQEEPVAMLSAVPLHSRSIFISGVCISKQLFTIPIPIVIVIVLHIITLITITYHLF